MLWVRAHPRAGAGATRTRLLPCGVHMYYRSIWQPVGHGTGWGSQIGYSGWGKYQLDKKRVEDKYQPAFDGAAGPAETKCPHWNSQGAATGRDSYV